jgi:hypothetical protein
VTFKAGDKVRYTGDCNTFSGHNGGFKPAEGVIMEPGRSGITNLQLTSAVQGHKEGSVVCLFTQNLELIKPAPAFTFADIQVGDKIRRTLTRETGTTEVREGTVVELKRGFATDAISTGQPGSSYILAYDSDGDPAKPQVVLELLDRPKPKHWTETKPVGSVAIFLDGIFTKTLKKTSEQGWNVLYAEDGYAYKASNDEIKTRATGWDESKVTWIK